MNRGKFMSKVSKNHKSIISVSYKVLSNSKQKNCDLLKMLSELLQKKEEYKTTSINESYDQRDKNSKD